MIQRPLAQPLVIPIKFEFDADTEMLEYVCAENERDRSHLIGKAADDRKNQVTVAPEILKQYVGLYELRLPPHPEDPALVDISLDGGPVDGGGQRRREARAHGRFRNEIRP